MQVPHQPIGNQLFLTAPICKACHVWAVQVVCEFVNAGLDKPDQHLLLVSLQF
jgi:hypothetical protein